MRALAAALVLAAALLSPGLAAAEDPPADTMQILREKVRADKKLMVAENMQLTEAEARGFWPLYESFQNDLQKINDRLASLIRSYATDFRNHSLTDERAKVLVDEYLGIQETELAMKKDYARRLGEVLPARKVARYLQIEHKIRAILAYELAAGVPLVD